MTNKNSMVSNYDGSTNDGKTGRNDNTPSIGSNLKSQFNSASLSKDPSKKSIVSSINLRVKKLGQKQPIRISEEQANFRNLDALKVILSQQDPTLFGGRNYASLPVNQS